MPNRQTVCLLNITRPERSRGAGQVQSPSRYSAGYPRVSNGTPVSRCCPVRLSTYRGAFEDIRPQPQNPSKARLRVLQGGCGVAGDIKAAIQGAAPHRRIRRRDQGRAVGDESASRNRKFESTPLQQRVRKPSAASMASCSTRWCTAPISRNSMAMCSDGGGLQLKRVLPLQRHHPHPEHHLVADVDVVFTHEGQLAVVADTKHRQAGGYWRCRIAVPHIHWQIVLRDQNAAARVDVKGAGVDLLRLDVLDRSWLAGGLIDRIHDDAVFTALEDWLALKLDRGLGTDCPV